MEFRDCLHETLRILDSAKDVFIYSASNKISYCITFYYIVLYRASGVKPFFNVFFLNWNLIRRKIYMLNFVLKKVI